MTIPIVFITDNNYVIPTGIAIMSILKNKKPKTKYGIHVIVSEDVTDDYKNKLLKCGSESCKVKIIEVNADSINKYKTKNHVTAISLYKFNIPDLLPEYDKVIYLDCDVLINKDLSEFYNLDIKEYYLAAVSDMTAVIELKITDNLNLPDYFNSGVMLLNISMMRNESIKDKLFKYKDENINQKHFFMDQTAMNVVLKDKIMFCHVKYNVMLFNFRNTVPIKEFYKFNEYYNTKYYSYSELINDAVILHLTHRYKPWKYTDSLFFKEWSALFEKSPLYLEDLDLTSIKDESINEHRNRINHQEKRQDQQEERQNSFEAWLKQQEKRQNSFEAWLIQQEERQNSFEAWLKQQEERQNQLEMWLKNQEEKLIYQEERQDQQEEKHNLIDAWLNNQKIKINEQEQKIKELLVQIQHLEEEIKLKTSLRYLIYNIKQFIRRLFR